MLTDYLKNRFGTPHEETSRILEPLQLELLRILLKVAMIATIPALVTGLSASVVEGKYVILFADIAAYALLPAALLILPRNYRLAAGLFVYNILFLGIVLLVTVGTEGASMLWLVAAILTATLLLKPFHTVVVFLISATALILTAILLRQGSLPWSIPVPGWIAVIGSYVGIAIFLSSGVFFLLNRLADAVVREQVLNREIQHRVRNNLQLVESMISIESGAAKHQETTALLQLMSDRISAIAHSFNSLTQKNNVCYRSRTLHVDTSSLIDAITADQQHRGRPAVSVHTETICPQLTLDMAVPLAVVLAELLHHFNRPGSHLELTATTQPDNTSLTLTRIRDDADGTPAPSIPSVQQEIMYALTAQFGATLELKPRQSSVLAVLTLPVTRIVG